MANEIGIPRIVFYSTRAFFTAVTNFIWKDVAKIISLPVVNFVDLPWSPTFKKEHLPSVCQIYKKSDPEREFLKDGMLANMSSYGCVINTFEA